MGQRWTEEDEARRIQMIKDQEKQMYEKEMSGYQRSSYSLTDKTSQKTNYENPYNNYESLKPKVSYTTSPIKYNFKPSNNNWCYRCASPYTKITPNMRHAVKNFLRIRRTSYPFDAIHDKCTKPDDLGVFKKQQCISSYCQTIVLTDHDTGNVFTIRGCAENFGAIDAKVLEERDDNTCTKLHDSLEMYECICKNRKYCYAGSERNIPDSSYSKVIVAQKSTQLLEENNTIKYTNNQWMLLIFTGFLIYMIF
uniref:Activin_recp domain-containing protein n=1 Tax=Strongyloides venezuelensis TaxID=75913 RepID=A0A0K0FN93_STRVS